MEGLLRRGSNFAWLKGQTGLFFVNAFLVGPMLMLFLFSPSLAQEPKVFTDADLSSYERAPMVDEQTAARMEEDLMSYEKAKDAELHLEREKKEKKRAEEMKRAASQKQDVVRSTVSQKGVYNNVVVSRVPVSQSGVYRNSGVTNKSQTTGKRST